MENEKDQFSYSVIRRLQKQILQFQLHLGHFFFFYFFIAYVFLDYALWLKPYENNKIHSINYIDSKQYWESNSVLRPRPSLVDHPTSATYMLPLTQKLKVLLRCSQYNYEGLQLWW